MTKTRPADVPLPPAEEETLTRLEACRVARIGLSTFDRAVVAKRLHVQRIGRKIVVKRDELDRFMSADAPDA
jgi:excisionase family DNA binding protein